MISLDDLLAQDLQESRVWIDDHLLQDEGIIVLLSSKELAAPSVRNMSVAVPGRHGSYDFGGWLEPRDFTLNLVFPRQSYADLKCQIRLFSTRFFDEYGRPKTVKLRFGDEIDKYFNARIVSEIPVERAADRGFLSIVITAYDPYAYSNVMYDEILWGSEIVTFEYQYLLGHEGEGGTVKIHESQTLNIDVEGVALQPIFEIEGSANYITISSGDYSFTLFRFIDTSWIIDFEKYLVYKNGKETMEDIDEFYLLPGNNRIRINGSNLDIDMRIKFRDKFI